MAPLSLVGGMPRRQPLGATGYRRLWLPDSTSKLILNGPPPLLFDL